MWKLISLGIIVLCLVVTGAAVCSAAQPLSLQTGNPDVTAGIRFEGALVPFWGDMPDGCQVVVKARGPVTTHPVRAKTGLDLSPAVVGGLPSLYQILSSVPLQDIGEDIRREIGIDPHYTALTVDSRVFNVNETDEADVPGGLRDLRSRQAVRQLVADGLYGHFEGAVETTENGFSGILYVPAGGPLKDIQLTAYAIKDGKIVATAAGSLDIPQRYFTRPFGETPEERMIYLGILFLSFVTLSLTALEWLQKGRTSPAARK
ncbi:MAG: TIGR02186 family protein [Thermoanaerobacterales bacterium]|nr:TIGR02186 family protein [Bacillota bacterium]MDI6906690.1 TIGR02186 family protein [Thermoanaerobacterales bacterium]